MNDIISLFFVPQKHAAPEGKPHPEEEDKSQRAPSATEASDGSQTTDVQTGQEGAPAVSGPTTSLPAPEWSLKQPASPPPATDKPAPSLAPPAPPLPSSGPAATTAPETTKKSVEETAKKTAEEAVKKAAEETTKKPAVEQPVVPKPAEAPVQVQPQPPAKEQLSAEKKVEEKPAEKKEEKHEAPKAPGPEDIEEEVKEQPEAVPKMEDDADVLQEEDKSATKGTRYGLLEKLFSFVNTSNEVNPVLAGYFFKVLQVIIEKRKLDLLEYIFTFREHIYNILKHSYNKSIADVLSKILSNEDKFITGTTGEEYSAEKRSVLDKMVGKMEPSNSIEDITNNCFILCNLVDTKQHLDYFLNPDVIKRIYNIGTTGHPMSLRACLTFFMTTIRTKISASTPNTAVDTFGFGGAPRIFTFSALTPTPIIMKEYTQYIYNIYIYNIYAICIKKT